MYTIHRLGDARPIAVRSTLVGALQAIIRDGGPWPVMVDGKTWVTPCRVWRVYKVDYL